MSSTCAARDNDATRWLKYPGTRYHVGRTVAGDRCILAWLGATCYLVAAGSTLHHRVELLSSTSLDPMVMVNTSDHPAHDWCVPTLTREA